jgi:hypothetical protein
VKLPHVLHGAGIFTYKLGDLCRVNVGKYSSTMEHLGSITFFKVTFQQEK